MPGLVVSVVSTFDCGRICDGDHLAGVELGGVIHTLRAIAMPIWLVVTSSCSAAGSRQARQRTTSSLREYSDRNRTPSGNGAFAAARVRAQQSPSRQLKLNMPGTPSVPSSPTSPIDGQTRSVTSS
jgi:hypothetical protein